MVKGNIDSSADEIVSDKRALDLSELVDEIRREVRSAVNASPELYDGDDVAKVFTNDFYVTRFLRWCRRDKKKTLNYILKCFQWRKSSGLIYRRAQDFPLEFFASGALFQYQQDVDGYPVLYMRVKFIRKVSELDEPFKDFIAYKINEIDEACGRQMSWTIVFDCNNIGFCNVHLGMLQYLISTLSNYFPFGVRKIIILDVPWILNQVQKMVYSMLPEEAKKVAVFATSKQLTKYISIDNLPDYLGGQCKIPYNQAPKEAKPFEELTDKFYNLNKKQLDKLRDIYKSLIELPVSS